MQSKTWISIAAAAVGLALGPSALASAKASRPPIDWGTIPIFLLGSIVGTFFVIGMQILRSEPKYGRRALWFFTPASMFFLGGGAGALANAALRGELGPASVLILAIGLGSVIGVFFSRIAYRAKFKSVL